ncbi:MAG TPA: flavodoxin family protein [Oscillospiraceae bacterium]|nr:flavodoxin family protein [Oscillospiraceae bacterium]HNW03913.1 flavodoxin family protein [Oscillospiraceae bacterium]HPV99484.1 flavodoxin family protein [Oscillospiraceae bacterium]
MKVLLVNGSPHEKGCTFTALSEIAETLKTEGMEAKIIWVGAKPISGCLGCKGCAESGRCVVQNDPVNEFLNLAQAADGFVFGSPVHYAAASGELTSFLDRAFHAAPTDTWRLKPGAAICSARRAGTTTALDQIQKYFTISEMPVVSSQYWNMVYGNTPGQVREDVEGLQTMRVLARNLAWFLRCKEAGEKAGVTPPEREPRLRATIIR